MLYGRDDDTISPGLEAQRPSYGPCISEAPPFEVDRFSGDGTKTAAGAAVLPGRFRKYYPGDTREGDSVLLKVMNPNRKDIAAYERDHPLGKELSSDVDLTRKDNQERLVPKLYEDSQGDLSEKATYALGLLKDSSDHGPFRNRSPPTREPAIRHDPMSPERERNSSVDSTYSTIRHLERFSIPASESRLPALQPSPTLGASSANTQILPSLHSALGELHGFPPRDSSGKINGACSYSLHHVPCSSPSLRRDSLAREPQFLGQFPSPQIPPSPYLHLSPTSSKDISSVSSPVSRQSYWRLPPKSELHCISPSFEASSPVMKSPASGYPTPTEQSPGERSPFSPSVQSNGSISTGVYKCQHPECTAPPFQTQYLLNSHANVHSQDRPHFCPVEGCPRGAGGKGFKRKNEMIRHGLVHNSPGYICPFCPDQQHRYPRPDNLQRHVRVHHVDKNRDHPSLRAVLSQRPEGSTRGRRRRISG